MVNFIDQLHCLLLDNDSSISIIDLPIIEENFNCLLIPNTDFQFNRDYSDKKCHVYIITSHNSTGKLRSKKNTSASHTRGQVSSDDYQYEPYAGSTPKSIKP